MNPIYKHILLFFSVILPFFAFAEIKIYEIQNATSATAADGKVSVFIEGAVNGTYTIVLTGTSSTTKNNVSNGVHTFDALRKGNYTVKVTINTTLSGGGLAAACDKTFSVTIGVCAANTITISETKSPLVCDGAKDGFIDITAQGGAPPYKYVWNIGKTTEDLNNLEGDKKYKVTVSDNQGCKTIKEIMVDGQKIEASLEVIKNSNTCDGELTLKTKVIGLATTLSYQWDRTPVVSTSDPSLYTKVCNGKHQVVIQTIQGCSIIVPFEVLGCSSKPLVALAYDTKENIASPRYCNDKSSIAINIIGGTSPYKYEFRDSKNEILIGKTLIIKNPSPFGFNVDLPSPKSKDLLGVHRFKVSDACGNIQNFDFNCNCDDKSMTYFRRVIDLHGEDQCDVDLGKSELYFDSYPQDADDDKDFKMHYFLTWTNGEKAEVTVINVGNQIGTPNKKNGITGVEKIKPKEPGCHGFVVYDERGCRDGLYTSFGTGGNLKSCAPFIDLIQNVPNIKDINFSFIPSFLLSQSATIGTYEYTICKYPKPCYAPLRLITDGTETLTEFKYFPDRVDFPCSSGKIQDACGRVYPVAGGEEFFDKTIDPNNTCKVPCACLFPYGQMTRYPYVGDQVFVKTEKYFNFQKCPDPSVEPTDKDDDPGDIKPDPNSPSSNPNSPCSGKLRDCSVPSALISEYVVGYSDCYFDVFCKKEPSEYIMKNCSRSFTCNYHYKYMSENFPSSDATINIWRNDTYKDQINQDECDVVIFCNKIHPANLLDPDKNHIVRVVPKSVWGGCTPALSDCQGYARKIKNDDDVDERKEHIEGFKFLQSDNIFAEIIPNPFEQELYLKLFNNKGKKVKISMYDILGRLIQTTESKNEDNDQFSLSLRDNLPQGMYIITLEGEDFRLQYPLVHQ